MCGCGEPAPIAKSNDKRYGIIKGLPQRYIRGHEKYKSPVDYIVDENGCWVWQRAVNSSGYGHLYVDGEHKYAHVHYYEMANGHVENNGRTLTSRQVHHTCGNKLCVNPEHLSIEPVIEHRRHHGIIKYSDDDVREVRRLRSIGVSGSEISKRLGISQSHIYAIANGARCSSII